MPRVLSWVVGGVLLLGVVALVVFDRVSRGEYEPVLVAMRQDVTAHVDLFCQEQAKLAADPWFHEPRTEGDAGPLLNHWVEWERPGPAMPEDSPLQLPAHLKEKKSLEEWLASDVDLSPLNFDWMRELHRFDRWDILSDTPFRPEGPFNLMTASVPNFISLLEWSKFRIIQGMRTGRPQEAARDLRQVAWLAYRTDTILGAMIAHALLRLEHRAHALMKEPPADWQPQSLEQLERMRAVFWASMAFSSMNTPVDVARKARSCGSAVSRCIGLVEASNVARYLQPVAETDHAEAYAEFQSELATPCPTSVLTTLWQRGVTIDDHPAVGSSMPDQPEWMRMLPRRYAGRHIAGLLLAPSGQGIDLLKKLRQGPPAPASAETSP